MVALAPLLASTSVQWSVDTVRRNVAEMDGGGGGRAVACCTTMNRSGNWTVLIPASTLSPFHHSIILTRKRSLVSRSCAEMLTEQIWSKMARMDRRKMDDCSWPRLYRQLRCSSYLCEFDILASTLFNSPSSKPVVAIRVAPLGPRRPLTRAEGGGHPGAKLRHVNIVYILVSVV